MIRPGRRRRIRYLYHEKRELFDRLVKAGALEEFEINWEETYYDDIETFGDLDPFDDQEILSEYYRRDPLRGGPPGTSGAPDAPVFEDEAFLREFYSAVEPPADRVTHRVSQPDLGCAFDPDEVPF